MRLLVVLAAVGTLVLAGCVTEMTYMECGDIGVSPQTDIGGDEDVVEADTGGPIEEALVGAVCSADDDCPTAAGWTPWCMTTTALAELMPVLYAVPGGLCSQADCASDADCGSDAACIDGGGLNYCVQQCDSFLDCRYTDGFGCAPVGEAPAACVPDGAVFLSQCGDGECDEDERYDATLCPADCPEDLPEESLVGGPCTADDECEEGKTCFTTEFLGSLLGPDADVEVPNGMCANHPLVAGCTETADCGEGGACVDGTALAGLPIMLCLHACETDADCRVLEGYRCFDTGGTEGDTRGCLPHQLISGIRCGDGVCDVAEIADPELCPVDNCAAE